VSFNLTARASSFFASLAPRTLAFAGGAAVFAILLQAGFIANLVIKESGPAHYTTASAPTTDPGVGAFTLIRFAPQATQDDVTKFLKANKFAIVEGPVDGGFYKVRISAAAMPKVDYTAIVKKLRSDKTVGFIATVE
jgi:hypothetical protein